MTEEDTMTDHYERQYRRIIAERDAAYAKIQQRASVETTTMDLMIGILEYHAKQQVTPDGQYTGSMEQLEIINKLALQRNLRHRDIEIERREYKDK